MPFAFQRPQVWQQFIRNFRLTAQSLRYLRHTALGILSPKQLSQFLCQHILSLGGCDSSWQPPVGWPVTMCTHCTTLLCQSQTKIDQFLFYSETPLLWCPIKVRGFFIKMRAAFLAPILPQVIKEEGNSRLDETLILIGYRGKITF